MRIPDVYKYGEGVPEKASKERSSDECCKGSPGFRTDYSQTMEPSRGPRTYPSVELIIGPTNRER